MLFDLYHYAGASFEHLFQLSSKGQGVHQASDYSYVSNMYRESGTQLYTGCIVEQIRPENLSPVMPYIILGRFFRTCKTNGPISCNTRA